MEGNRVEDIDQGVREKLVSTLKSLNVSCSDGNNVNRNYETEMAFRRYLADQNSDYLDKDMTSAAIENKKRSGLSRFHSTELADAIMWMLPDLLRAMRKQSTWIDVEATPAMPVEIARVASRELEKIFQDNDPNRVFDTFIQNGLLVGNGFLIIQLMERDKKRVSFDDLNTSDFNELIATLEKEGAKKDDISTTTEKTDDLGNFPDGIRYSVEAFRKMGKKIHIDSIPPESVLVPARTDTIDQSNPSGPPYIAIRQIKSRTELLRMFPEKAELINHEDFSTTPTDDPNHTHEVEQERQGDAYYVEEEFYNFGDKKMERSFVCYDEYVRYDLDGDGEAELINVFRSDKNILYIANVENNPLAPWSCLPVPNRFRAKGLNHRIGMIQDLISRLTRTFHNGVAFGTFPVRFVDGSNPSTIGTTPNDFIKNFAQAQVGAIVKTPGPPKEVVSQLDVDSSITQLALEGIYVTRDMGERRIGGMTPQSNTKGSNAYQRTATGQHLGQQREQVPTEYIADNLAAGLAIAAQKVYKLLVSSFDYMVNVDEKKGLEISVADFDINARIKIHVGGAILNRDQKISHLMTIAPMQMEIMDRIGLDNPLVSIKEVGETLNELVGSMGFSHDQKFSKTITDEDIQRILANQKPDPKEMEIEMKREEMLADMERKNIEAQHTMDLEYQKFLLEQWKVAIEAQNKTRQMEIEALLKVREMAIEERLEKMKIAKDEKVEREKVKMDKPVRPGGKVG